MVGFSGLWFFVSLQGANYHPINWCDGEIYITFISSISYFSKNTLRGVYGVWTFQGLTSTAARTCSHGAYWSCAPCEWRERVCQCAASGRGPEDLQVWSATRVDQLIGDKLSPPFIMGMLECLSCYINWGSSTPPKELSRKTSGLLNGQ